MRAFGLVYRRIGFLITGIFLAWGVAGPVSAAAPTIDVIDWRSSPVDLSFLNKGERPAGKRGFVRAEREGLVFADGSAARFWGTNIAAATLFGSDRAAVREHAHRLSQLGFNLVRLHHHDSFWNKPNVFGTGAERDTRRLDPAMLEKIDWWIRCLKDEGIYVWLDLHVQRHLLAGDGISDFDEIAHGHSTVDLKGFNYVNDDIERAMKTFNEAYLGHVNGHTGLAYKDDPAVAAVLITNENDLTEHYGNSLLPNQKVPRHNARYMAEARAFARAHGLSEDQVWRSWQRGPSKLFLNDLEQRFNARMISHLRGIGVKVPIVTTNLWGGQMSSLPALAAGDMIDVHAYEEAGFLERDPRVAGNVVHTIAAAQLAGMPVSVTEWNMGKFPTQDRQDLPLYVAATATHQGWDALMHYAYAQKALQLPAAASNWHAINDPARLAMLPAAALLYRQRHVREAASVYTWSPSAPQLFDGSTPGSDWVALRVAAERGRLVTVLPPVPELPWLRPTAAPTAATAMDKIARNARVSKPHEVVSDTGELRRDWKIGVFTVDTPRSQAAVGSIGSRSIAMTDVTIRMDTPRVSVAVQTLDDAPLDRSSDILVSIASSSVLSEGSRLPFLSEPTVGDIDIRAKPGLQASEQSGVQVRFEGNRYVVHFDGKSAVHWVSLRRPSKGGQ